MTTSSASRVSRIFAIPLFVEGLLLVVFAACALVSTQGDAGRAAIVVVFCVYGFLCQLPSAQLSAGQTWQMKAGYAVGWGLWLTGFITVMQWAAGTDLDVGTFFVTLTVFLIAGGVLASLVKTPGTTLLEPNPKWDAPGHGWLPQWQWLPPVLFVVASLAVGYLMHGEFSPLFTVFMTFTACLFLIAPYRLALAMWRQRVLQIAWWGSMALCGVILAASPA
ncbi:MAG: hypothetical protein AAFY65_02140 [Pseudomonadota bacterium]